MIMNPNRRPSVSEMLTEDPMTQGPEMGPVEQGLRMGAEAQPMDPNSIAGQLMGTSPKKGGFKIPLYLELKAQGVPLASWPQAAIDECRQKNPRLLEAMEDQERTDRDRGARGMRMAEKFDRFRGLPPQEGDSDYQAPKRNMFLDMVDGGAADAALYEE